MHAGADRRPSRPDSPPPPYTFDNGLGPSKGDNLLLRWDEELLQAVLANPGGTGPTVTARAIGVAHTSRFDAWAARADDLALQMKELGYAVDGSDPVRDDLAVRPRHPGPI